MVTRNDISTQRSGLAAGLASRRDFIRCGCSTGILLALGANLTGCVDATGTDPGGGGGGGAGASGVTISPSTITLDLAVPSLERLRASGGFLFIADASVIVINSAGTFRAFTSVCTHQGFSVDSFSAGRMVCSGHGAQFNPDGTVASGLAPRALREFGLTRSGDTVTIQRG
jgi:cytochrome b6-f complex iron-sulfur subunit